MYRKKWMLILLIVLVQIISVDSIIVSYGIVTNNKYQEESEFESKKKINFAFTGERPTVEALKNAFPGILGDYEEALSRVAVDGLIKIDEDCNLQADVDNNIGIQFSADSADVYLTLSTLFSVSGGKYVYDEKSLPNFEKSLTGTMYTEDEMNSGANVCLVNVNLLRQVKDKLVLSSKGYDILGYLDSDALNSSVYMPLSVMPDETQVQLLAIYFNRMLTADEYEDIVDRFEEIFPGYDCTVQDYVKMDVDVESTRKTMVIIAVFLSLLAVITIYQVYRYKLEQDKPALSVRYLCGQSSVSLYFMYLKGMIAMFAVSALAAYACFKYVLFDIFRQEYVWFDVIYKKTPVSYMCIIAVGISFTILALRNVRFFMDSPYNMWAKRMR